MNELCCVRSSELEIDVILDDRIIDLVAEGVDLSLRMGELSDSPAVARKLATGGRSVVATPAYLEKAGEPCSPADLAEHATVIYSQLPNVWSFKRDGTDISVAVHGRVRVSVAEGLRAAVLADIGLTSHPTGCLPANWRVALSERSWGPGNSLSPRTAVQGLTFSTKGGPYCGMPFPPTRTSARKHDRAAKTFTAELRCRRKRALRVACRRYGVRRDADRKPARHSGRHSVNGRSRV
jgi:LysR substrate binding domain